MKGTTPQWQHFSLQTYADAFWRLLNCTWYRQGPFSFKSKTDCFSLGRGLLDKQRWQSRDSAALWGGGGQKGVSLWIVCVHVFFCVSLLYMPVSHKKIMFVSMCFKCVHVWVTTKNAWARSSLWSRQDLWIFVSTSDNNFLPLFITCSHPPFSLILASSTLSLFHFPLSVTLLTQLSLPPS